jgi:hypothetical protein
MTTPLDEAQAHADEIQQLTSAEVELHHNNTTPKDKFEQIVVKVAMIVGIKLTVIAADLSTGKKKFQKKVNPDIKKEVESSVNRLVASISNDYIQIQNRKIESARRLADKVVCHLKQNRLSNVTLILHSQGADIGRRALQQLEKYKGRINVITIGGMVDISKESASRVANFVEDNDFIAQAAKIVFGSLLHVVIKYPVSDANETTKNNQCETALCHGSLEYLKIPEIQKAIAEFSKPKILFR